jgi:hypothetical protein
MALSMDLYRAIRREVVLTNILPIQVEQRTIAKLYCVGVWLKRCPMTTYLKHVWFNTNISTPKVWHVPQFPR